VQIPAPDPDLASAIERALAEIERLSSPAEAAESVPAADDRHGGGVDDAGRAPHDTILDRLGDLLDPVAFGERIAAAQRVPAGDAARVGAARLGADELAWLLHLASRPAVRDAIMLQLAFGPVVGELALDLDAAGAADDSWPDVADGPDYPDRPWEPGPADRGADDLLARLLLGQTTVRPDPDRIERALDVLAVAVANAPAAQRPGALCIAAWLAWALGRGSAAGALLDRVLAEAPEHRMAGLLHAFVGSGALPEWAFSEPAAGSGR
jgi:hypothetical protein